MRECVARQIHECWGPDTSQHWPKRSQGGREVVARLCLGLHDAIDNGFRYQGRRWKNYVAEEWGDGRKVYVIADRETEEILLSVPIREARNGASEA